MTPEISTRYYNDIVANQKSINALIDEIIGSDGNYSEQITLTRGDLIRLGCCLTSLTNSILWNEEKRIAKIIGGL